MQSFLAELKARYPQSRSQACSSPSPLLGSERAKSFSNSLKQATSHHANAPTAQAEGSRNGAGRRFARGRRRRKSPTGSAFPPGDVARSRAAYAEIYVGDVSSKELAQTRGWRTPCTTPAGRCSATCCRTRRLRRDLHSSCPRLPFWKDLMIRFRCGEAMDRRGRDATAAGPRGDRVFDLPERLSSDACA